jgi:hypothetical protein
MKANDGEEIPAMLKKCSTSLSYPVARRGLTVGFSVSPKLGDKVIL